MENENAVAARKRKDAEVLYEDAVVLVLDKPAGLLVHTDLRSPEDTLVDWVLQTRPEIKGVGEDMRLQNGSVIERSGIVHRLDRETSGVIIVAKTQEAFLYLKEQFQNHAVSKIYNAFVYGTPPETRGVIDRPIGRNANNPRLWSAQRGARGTLREARTEYRVLKEGDGVSYVEAFPKTGRTHQLRVHFKAIHHPIVCDRLYAPKQPCLLNFNRLALHARLIRFCLPGGKEKECEAPLPADFIAALALIEKKS